jgi:hypothetical protein
VRAPPKRKLHTWLALPGTCNEGQLISSTGNVIFGGVPADSYVRRTKRERVRLAVVLLVDAEGTKLSGDAVSLDFSRLGLGVETKALLTPGQVVDIVPAEGPNSPVRSRVAWVGPVRADESCTAGLEFLEPLPE